MKTHKAEVILTISTKDLSVDTLKSALKALDINYKASPSTESSSVDIKYSANFADSDFNHTFNELLRCEVEGFEIPRIASLLRAQGIDGMTENTIVYKSSCAGDRSNL